MAEASSATTNRADSARLVWKRVGLFTAQQHEPRASVDGRLQVRCQDGILKL
ncbi:MAG: hypothetical protein ACJ788_21445 [Ktedonobacteraceae bacterium]